MDNCCYVGISKSFVAGGNLRGVVNKLPATFLFLFSPPLAAVSSLSLFFLAARLKLPTSTELIKQEANGIGWLVKYQKGLYERMVST